MAKKQGRSHFGIIIVILLLALILAGVFLGRWQLQISLLGEAETSVEFGEAYTDPGAKAFFGEARLLPRLFSP